jgi:ATP-dependent DNA helicase DinG
MSTSDSIKNIDIYSIIKDVVFLDIQLSDMLEIYMIKIDDGNSQYFKEIIDYKNISISYLEKIEDDILKFIGDLPIICHDFGPKKQLLRKYINKDMYIYNLCLDSMELSAILEPTINNFSLQNLINITTNFENVEDIIANIYLVNSLLIRFWKSKLGTEHLDIIGFLGKEDIWNWTKYLYPVDYDKAWDVNVNFDNSKNNKNINNNIDIDYSIYEELLKYRDIWQKNSSFKYFFRQGQYNVSKEIRKSLEENKVVCIEAPTGIGKSIAYLLASVIYSYIKKEKVFISTNTKNLQNQLISKDIPKILEILNLNENIKYLDIKGKKNYTCYQIFDRYIKNQNFGVEDRLSLLYIQRLIENGEFGDIEEINSWAKDNLNNLNYHLNNIRIESELCFPKRCIYSRKCYYANKIKELKEANIIVVNHSLMLNWAYNTEVGAMKNIVVDEAHNLIDQCYNAFSDEVESIEIQKLLNDLYDYKNKKGYIYYFMSLYKLSNFESFREHIENINMRMYVVVEFLKKRYYRQSDYNYVENIDLNTELGQIKDQFDELSKSLEHFAIDINKMLQNMDEEDKEDILYKTLDFYVGKLKNMVVCITHCFEQREKGYCYSIEVNKDHIWWKINKTELDIAKRFKLEILDNVDSITFTSATLRVDNSLKHFKNTLGINKLESSRILNDVIEKPVFDYKKRSVIGIPMDIDNFDYKNEEVFINNMSKFIIDIVKNISGNILVLFTSTRRKNSVKDNIIKTLEDSDVMVFDDNKSVSKLKDSKNRCVILGSKSFFEGVDIPGDNLTCVILDKIPNIKPNEPLSKSLMNKWIKDNNYILRDNNDRLPYNKINYPKVIINLKQIFGRLLRSKYDYGYFFVLSGLKEENWSNVRKIERDMSGPLILRKNTDDFILDMKNRYNNWRKLNLNEVISETIDNIRKVDISSKENEFKVKKYINNEFDKRSLNCKVTKIYIRQQFKYIEINYGNRLYRYKL